MRAEGTGSRSEGTGLIRKAQVVLWLAAVVVGVLAATAAGQSGPKKGDPPDLDKAIAAMEKHADQWLDKQNVVGVGIGENKAGNPVIHVYKLKDDDEGIPSDVDGVAVEHVRSGRFDPRALPTDRWPRPVPIGVSSGLADFATGTLGARVTDGTNVYALSNNHVFAGVNTGSVGDAITQPGVEDGGSDPADRIATLADYQAIDFSGGNNIMDAAIAVTSAGNVATATPPDGYGAPSTTPAAAAIGMGVQKYGRTTGFQLGAVQDVNFSVDVCYFALGEFCFPGYEARFVDQISVSGASFSAPGDSGSLMVTQGGNQPVALLFAGDGQLTIGNPIIPVLQRFGVTIDGAPPGDGPPGAPTALSALAGDASVSLSWNAPTFDGGSPLANYKVYRGTSPNPTVVVGSPTGTSFTDSGLTNGQTYYYRVSAVNANGEGAPSNQASATPIAAVAPEPLVALDTFDRPNENPLSDAGRWSNSVFGSSENGLHVSSNALACSLATTCTAWRNNAQYGPDAEAWARWTTLPGNGNQLRLYVRLQQPNASAGYMLGTNQLAGTDEVWLERFGGGAATRLLTIRQELAVGDVILLRAKGSSIEAWRNNGSWARLGVVQDATHSAPGFVAVGLRGTIGRLDDFGGRTMGAPPPDTEDPSAPGTLTAAAFSSSQIDLSWGPATDNVGVTHYRVERCSGVGCSDFAQVALSTSTRHMDVGLAASTAYSYRVRAVDAAGNEGPYSNVASAATPAPPDTEPPSVPTNLNATAASSTQIDLTWQAATDSVGVVRYRIERCQGAGCSVFTEIAATTGTSYSNTGLSASISYSYRVRAEDAAGNQGAYSNTASATTPAPPDTEPPTASWNLTATATSATQIDLAWSAATDNVAVTLYRIERCQGAGCSVFTEIATTASTSFSNTALTAATSYSYRVRAQDAVPNTGDYSNVASATTLAAPTDAPVEPLPVVDAFNRRNENPLSDGGRWSNGIGSVDTGLRVVGSTLGCTKSTACTASRNDANYGPDTEVWARVAALPGTGNELRLYARLQQAGQSTHSGYLLRAIELSGTDEVRLERIDAGAVVTRLAIAQELAVGDTLLLRVKGATLEGWLKRGSSWSLLGSVADSTYAAAGRVGVGIRGKSGRLDDFGAR